VLDTEKKLFNWVNGCLDESGKSPVTSIVPLREEASFRRYYRLEGKDISLVGVHSPSDLESNNEFISLSEYFISNNVSVPAVLAYDFDLGFLLVEDFGNNLYQYHLNKENYKELLSHAVKEMITIQSCPATKSIKYLDKQTVQDQITLFESWFLEGFLEYKVSEHEKSLLNKAYDLILDSFFEQPQVLSHFDFESRNIMILENNKAGILDFQDAVFGPIFLDPVSLFRDLDNQWDDKEVEVMLGIYLEGAKEAGLIGELDSDTKKRWFDLTALQRQLRILGTLSRLHIRDNKSYRLPDLKKTLDYAIKGAKDHKELGDFSDFLTGKVLPLLENRMDRL
jgi:aminoglycoside/choline kinase family phosphotransferase|tara:strand:- start:906 stop:1919 length:1014 start_codon:yes stop_codon:yes gene_type:complete